MLRTYLYYRNILKRVEKNSYPHRPPLYLREDLRQLKNYSEQALVLARYKVHTMPQLQERKEIINQEIKELNHDRNQLRRKLRTVTGETEIAALRFQIAAVSAQIKPKFKEVKLLEEVEKRAINIARKVDKTASDIDLAKKKMIGKDISSK